MKRICFLFLLLLSGCVSANLDNYGYMTLAQVDAKRRANEQSQADIYNKWYYAGSDDKYDYIYEFEKGVSITPPSNFHYYKLDKGQLGIKGSYPFKPDPDSNTELFTGL